MHAKIQQLVAAVMDQDRRELELRALQARIDAALATPARPDLRGESERLQQLARENAAALRALLENVRDVRRLGSREG